MPSSMTTTTGTTTIKRTHIQQLIDAWNGTTSVPLVLNGQGTDATSLTIKSNGVNPPMKIVDPQGFTVFSIGTNGVISPNVSSTAGPISLGATPPATMPTTAGFYYGATTTSVASVNVSAASSNPMRWTSSNAYAGGTTPTNQIMQTLETYNMAAGNLAILLRPTTTTASSSITQGLYMVLRANANVASTVYSRDYNIQAVADGFPTGTGDVNVVGSLNITTDLNDAGAVPIAKFKSRGFFTGIYSPPVNWLDGDATKQDPQTTVASGTETTYDTKIITTSTSTSTTVALAGVGSPLTSGTTYPTPPLPVNQPRGSLPVFRSDITGSSGAYTFTGSWGRLPASTTQGLVLQADTSAPVLNPYGMKWGLPTSALTGLHREVIYPQQMTAVQTVNSPGASQFYAPTYSASNTLVGTLGTNVSKAEWRFPRNDATTYNVTTATNSLVVGDTYKVISLGSTSNTEWLALAGFPGTVTTAGVATATTTPTFAVNSGFTAALAGSGTGSGTVQRVNTTAFCTVPIPTGWKSGNFRVRLYYSTTGSSSGIAWQVGYGIEVLLPNASTTAAAAFPTLTNVSLPVSSTAATDALRMAETTIVLGDLAPVTIDTVATYGGVVDLAITRLASTDAVAVSAFLRMVVVEFGI